MTDERAPLTLHRFKRWVDPGGSGLTNRDLYWGFVLNFHKYTGEIEVHVPGYGNADELMSERRGTTVAVPTTGGQDRKRRLEHENPAAMAIKKIRRMANSSKGAAIAPPPPLSPSNFVLKRKRNEPVSLVDHDDDNDNTGGVTEDTKTQYVVKRARTVTALTDCNDVSVCPKQQPHNNNNNDDGAMVGVTVRKHFQGYGWFSGIVQRVDENHFNGEPCFFVRYNDDDTEHVTRDELLRIMVRGDGGEASEALGVQRGVTANIQNKVTRTPPPPPFPITPPTGLFPNKAYPLLRNFLGNG